MIKKIISQTVIFSFLSLGKVFAAESGGMPQLNPEFWISQIFWLTLTFGILYLVLSKLILPKISANLEARKSQISDINVHREVYKNLANYVNPYSIDSIYNGLVNKDRLKISDDLRRDFIDKISVENFIERLYKELQNA